MPERAFPVIYAREVERSVRFYQLLGFEPHCRLPAEGEAGYVGLRRGATVADLGGNPVALAVRARPGG